MTSPSSFRSAVCLGWMLVGTAALAQGERRVSAFGPGEESTYSIEYLGVTAATARITVGAEDTQWGQKVMPIVTFVRSEGVVELFPVRDKFITYWQPAKEWTAGCDIFANENRMRRRERFKFDHTAGRATTVKQRNDEAERTGTYDIAPGTVDIGAAMFALRNKPLAVGAEFEVPVFTGSKSFTLRAKVEGIEKLQTTLGVREVFRIRVQTGFSGSFATRGDLTAYMTTDEARLPVRVEADFVVGTLKAVLTDYKGGQRYAFGG
jgi:Protein of unknown function (DUF3108)